jgi:hypothetical protein
VSCLLVSFPLDPRDARSLLSGVVIRPSRLCAVIVAALAVSCSDPEKAREREGIKPTYDKTTGRLKELTYDSNHNGKVDTWTDMDGARPLRTRIDRNEDGRLDRWEYYDPQGQLQKVGFSRKDDGKPDAWAYSSADGRIERIEISSAGDDTKIDRWERYDPSGLVSAEDDGNSDGTADKWETYQAGALRTAAWDDNGDGKPDRRFTYDAGALVTIESEPDTAGAFTKRVEVK